MITAKIESMKKIPKTCSECRLQGKDSQCAALSDEHQSCPVTFHRELLEEAGNDVFKSGRRCLCPLKTSSTSPCKVRVSVIGKGYDVEVQP